MYQSLHSPRCVSNAGYIPCARYFIVWIHTYAYFYAHVSIQILTYLGLDMYPNAHHLVVGINHIGHIPRPRYVSKMCSTWY